MVPIYRQIISTYWFYLFKTIIYVAWKFYWMYVCSKYIGISTHSYQIY